MIARIRQQGENVGGARVACLIAAAPARGGTLMRSNVWLHYSTGGLIINQLDRGNQLISLSICKESPVSVYGSLILDLGLAIGAPLANPPNALRGVNVNSSTGNILY